MLRLVGQSRPVAMCLFALLLSLSGIGAYRALADCPGFRGEGGLDPDPNVLWTFEDSISACPAGDSLIWAINPHKPSQLRIVVSYFDDNCDPKVGVPPESIYVVTENYSGNAKANDQPKVYADDSTNASGMARVTVRSLSGSGRIKFRVFVSGVEQGGYSLPYVRTTDTNADGRTTSGDATGMADLNYNGTTLEVSELFMLSTHIEHWHRNALFGRPIRLTNLCGTCDEETDNTLGDSEMFWSPDGKRLSFTKFITVGGGGPACTIFLMPSDPKWGSVQQQFSFPPADIHDYDPSWSPLGTEIAWDRHDNTIWRKSIPGIVSPVDSAIVIERHIGILDRGAAIPAISPDGKWIAFTLKESSGPYHLWKIPVSGDSTQMVKLTNTTDVVDFFPQWSPDGRWVIFDRALGGSQHQVFKVRSNGDSLQAVLAPATPGHASLPSYSPDGAVVIAASGTENHYTTHTIVAGLDSTQTGVENYAEYVSEDYILTPRWAPDGTRVSLRAGPPGTGELHQLWATRRNMSLPPAISTIGGFAVVDSIPYHDWSLVAGTAATIGVSASDPESDALTYAAYFLRTDLGMAFNTTTNNFTWTPGNGLIGQTFNVKFIVTTPSGGTDYAIARLSVVQGGGCEDCDDPPIIHGSASQRGGGPPVQTVRNGVYFLDVVLGPGQSAMSLDVFDVRGRHVKSIASGDPGSGRHKFVWRLDDTHGSKVAPSVYFVALRAGGVQRVKRLIIIP
jgi:hypothetical protein